MEDNIKKRGGARPGAGRPKGDSRMISFRAPGALADKLDEIENRTDFIKSSIDKALRERESGIGWIEGMVPAGEGGFSHALEDCSFAKEGTIPGYFCRDGLYQDADLYALDLREDEEDDEEDRQRTYVISMLRDGYDDGNTAYFCGVDEAYVAAVRQELGIPEPVDQI